MIIINFSHPLTETQLAEIQQITGQEISVLTDRPVHFDPQLPFIPQIQSLVEGIPLDGRAWQNEAILINPPALNFITAVLLAELHGRMGYFPPILRLRQLEGSLPPVFEAAEVLNLQAVRDTARRRRQ